MNCFFCNKEQELIILNWSEFKYGVPQWSILGSLLFEIDICNLFIELEKSEEVDKASYAIQVVKTQATCYYKT